MCYRSKSPSPFQNRLTKLLAQPSPMAAFNGSLYLQMRDEPGTFFTDDDFMKLSLKRGQPDVREYFEALHRARTTLTSEERWAEYRKRAGIEGTLSQSIQHCDLRHSRYCGLLKTNLQHIMTAAGLNVLRPVNYLNGQALTPTRKSSLLGYA